MDCFQFEVPALFIQWECFHGNSIELVQSISELCRVWSQTNLCGRLVVVVDGTDRHTGTVSSPPTVVLLSELTVYILKNILYIVKIYIWLHVESVCATVTSCIFMALNCPVLATKIAGLYNIYKWTLQDIYIPWHFNCCLS